MLTPQKGEVLSGCYELRELLGEGGQAWVYLAADREEGTEVAVKVLKAGSLAHTSSIKRFEREIRTLQRLSHPDIVRYLNHGREGDRFYLVVELLHGRSLAERAGEFRGQSEKVLALGVRLARALAAAHAAGVVHRDLKPMNIFLANTGKPRVLDGGVAPSIQAARAWSHQPHGRPLLPGAEDAGLLLGRLRPASPGRRGHAGLCGLHELSVPILVCRIDREARPQAEAGSREQQV